MKADLHVHTMFSNDGRTTPEQLLKRAEELGIGCIAVTDHNEFKAYDLLKDNGKVIIIPAEEVSSDEGHIIALGIDRRIPPRKSIQETIDLIHEAGGYAFAAHPYRWWSGLGEKNTLSYDFDGTEARNGRNIPIDNKRSMKLAKHIGKPITAGSDAHTPIHIGKCYLEIPDDVTTWQEAVDAIMHRECAVSGHSRHLWESIKFGLKTFFLFSRRGFRKI